MILPACGGTPLCFVPPCYGWTSQELEIQWFTWLFFPRGEEGSWAGWLATVDQPTDLPRTSGPAGTLLRIPRHFISRALIFRGGAGVILRTFLAR